MNCVNKIDWPLFRVQKQTLIDLLDNDHLMPDAQREHLQGILHLLDAIQDEFEPLEVPDGL